MNFDNLEFIPDALKPWMPLITGTTIALAIMIIGWLVAGWAARIVRNLLERREVDPSLVQFLASLVRWILIAAAVMTALERVGLQTTSLLALLGSAGIAVGLALQGNLSHFASGVMILLFRPFRIGDYILSADHEGRVVEIGLFTTRLHTLDTELIIVPNGSLTSNVITNYTALGKRRARIAIGVAYGSKVAEVLPVLQAAAERCDLVLKDPGPVVNLVGFGTSSVDYLVLPHSLPENYIPMLHQVKRAIYEDLDAAGIEIPFMQVVLHKAGA